MSQAKRDRRSVRTRSSLERSLLALIRRKPYEAITVQEICDGADIGRSTFYAHYRGKDDLKRSGLEHLRSALVDAQNGPTDSRLRFSLALFEHARAHLDVYRALKRGRGERVALNRVRQIVAEVVREEPEMRANRSDVAAEVAQHYLAGAYMAVLTWWLDGGARLPPATVDAIFRRFADPLFDCVGGSRE
jgi:AcrR family transcriptional regulator